VIPTDGGEDWAFPVDIPKTLQNPGLLTKFITSDIFMAIWKVGANIKTCISVDALDPLEGMDAPTISAKTSSGAHLHWTMSSL